MASLLPPMGQQIDHAHRKYQPGHEHEGVEHRSAGVDVGQPTLQLVHSLLQPANFLLHCLHADKELILGFSHTLRQWQRHILATYTDGCTHVYSTPIVVIHSVWYTHSAIGLAYNAPLPCISYACIEIKECGQH